jgi:hypothetical protein
VKNAFKALDGSLQTFAATFEELKKFSPETNAGIRNTIIDNIYAQLTQVGTNN